MAKGIGVHGNARGKVGNLVGSVLNGQQVWRGYQPSVKNPNSLGQIAQRMKLTPAINFYNGLEGILDHSWQGTRYGSASRNRFMALALRMEDGFPYVLKGVRSFVPGNYPISEGSLGTSEIVGQPLRKINGIGFPTSLGFDASALVEDDPASFVTALVNANANLQVGDQITVIAVDSRNGFVPVYERLILDAASFGDNVTSASLSLDATGDSSEYTLSVSFVSGQRVQFILADTKLYFGFSSMSNIDGGTSAVAAGIIISRKRLEGNSVTWQRSNAHMMCIDGFAGQYFSAAAYEAALASYRGAVNDVNSEWYLNQGDGQAFTGQIRVFSHKHVNTPVEGVADPVPTGTYYVLGAVDAQGNTLGIFTVDGSRNGSMIKPDGSSSAYFMAQFGWAYKPLKWDASYLDQLGNSNNVEAPDYEEATPTPAPSNP